MKNILIGSVANSQLLFIVPTVQHCNFKEETKRDLSILLRMERYTKNHLIFSHFFALKENNLHLLVDVLKWEKIPSIFFFENKKDKKNIFG